MKRKHPPGLYLRGSTYWMQFIIQGQRVRESTHTGDKDIAKAALRERRREMEMSVNGIRKRPAPVLLRAAAEQWLESKTALTTLGRVFYAQYVGKLSRYFGNRLLTDITPADIAALQRTRLVQGLSGRQVNCEVATLRSILKWHGLWYDIAPRVKMLRERADTGQALSGDDEAKLLNAIAASPSPSLRPFFILSLDAGLRPSETRALRRRNVDLGDGVVIVGQSKTAAGTGRVVPLTQRASAALALWLVRFPQAGPDAYVFPFHHVGFAGNGREPHVWAVDLMRPMGIHSYKRAFDTARRIAGVRCRFYDARHTFVTRLAENPAVAPETIRQLAGHVSERMLTRYAHIRTQARRDAIATLEQRNTSTELPQKLPHLAAGDRPVLH